MNKDLNKDIRDYRGGAGEKLIQAIFEYNKLLKINKIPDVKGETISDFFVKKGGENIVVCEVKTFTDTIDPRDQVKSEELSEFAACHDKFFNDFGARDKNRLTDEEKKEYSELKEKYNKYCLKNEESSKRHEKNHYSKIQKHFDKAMKQLSGYRNSKILGFVSFDMTDFKDLKDFLEGQYKLGINTEFPDLCILVKAHELIYRSGKFTLKQFRVMEFTEQGKKLMNSDLLFIKSLSFPLKIEIKAELDK